MKTPKRKVDPKRVRLQVQLPTEIAKAIRRRAVDELKNVSKLLTEWVESWKEKKK
jgi:hypothetical protein